MSCSSCVKWTAHYIFALICYPLLVPVFLLSFVGLRLLTLCSLPCGGRAPPNSVRLSYTDELSLKLGRTDRVNITSLIFLRGLVKREELVDQIEKHWLGARSANGKKKFYQFSSRAFVRCGRSYWTEVDEVDLSRHVQFRTISSHELDR